MMNLKARNAVVVKKRRLHRIFLNMSKPEINVGHANWNATALLSNSLTLATQRGKRPRWTDHLRALD